MPVTVTCECGHVTELAAGEQPDDAAVVTDQVCSACGRPLKPHTPAGKRMFQYLWQSHVGDENATAVSTPPIADVAEPAPARRSLWDVMRSSTDTRSEQPAVPAETARPDDAPAATSSAVEGVKPKGLWGVMHVSEPTPLHATTDVQPVESREPIRSDVAASVTEPSANLTSSPSTPTVVPELSAEKKYAQAAALAAMTHVQSTWQPEPGPEPFTEDEREWSRGAVAALACAGLAVLMSGLSYRPEWWWRGPALVLGFIAVLLGFMASGDVWRSRGRLKGRWAARTGVLLGTFGMFLAPIVFARLGEQARENAGREEIHWRLRRVGQGLDQFHAQQGHFPEAAIKGRDSHGDKVPMHGWMTPLLPSLGYEAVYRRIDLKQPYDAGVNVAAMQQPIPEFTLPHRKPVRSPRGFALTHFAGVGGQDVREPTGLVHFGLFSDGGPVRREDFTDGLSQTIVVGEIRDALPPWGEPSNVRVIGEGLNRQFRGFGNANGTGATFLHADGSVKFYSNKTDRRVLERLETRDGAEPE